MRLMLVCGVVNRHPNDRVCFLDDHPGLFGRFIRRERCFGLAVNLEAESPDLGSPVLRERFRGWLFMIQPLGHVHSLGMQSHCVVFLQRCGR